MRILSSLILAAGLLTGAAQAAPTVGQAAPAFSVTNSDGGTTKLGDLKGPSVILEWTNDGCPCVK